MIDIKNLPELITYNDFKILFDSLMENQNKIESNEMIECLLILGEKFVKFYNVNLLGEKERDVINKTLIESTDFNQLSKMEDLISILFFFRIDKYAEYLENNFNLVKDKLVSNEIKEALIEYRVS